MRTPLAAVALCGFLLAQQPMAPLVGVVVDAGGEPVQDATVVVYRAMGRGFRCLDLVLRDTWREQARTRVDKSGRFGLQLPRGLTLRVEVDHPPHALWRRDELVPGDGLRIELTPACTFRGRLVLADGGAVVAGELRGWRSDPTGGTEQAELFRGRTAADGTFAFDRLPPGRFTCDVRPDTAMSPDWFEGELASAAPTVHEFALAKGGRLRGTVTDFDTGAPVAGARVGEGWTLHKSATTAVDGTYELAGFGDPGRARRILCRASAYANGVRDLADLSQDPTVVDFALERGVTITGKVVDADGKPVAAAYAAAIAVQSDDIPWQASATAADGAFAIAGFARRSEAVLMLRRDGFATSVFVLPPLHGGGVIDLGTLALEPPHVVHGVVRDGRGNPVAGAVVHLEGTNADRNLLAPDPTTWSMLRHYAGEREARTGADGVFAFGDVAVGSYRIAVADQLQPATLREAVEVVAGEDAGPLKLWDYGASK